MSRRHESRFPDFLGIGATRGGSSWLYRVLSHHPDVWMPPVKELHYFDKPEEGRRTVCFADRQLAVRARDFLRGDVHSGRTEGFTATLCWDAAYWFGRRSQDWYESLFRPHPGQICGEITPAYATLDKDVVRSLKQRNPALKALYLLRHPVDRAWSNIVNGLARKRRKSIQEVPVAEILRKASGEGFLLRCDYARTLSIWRDVLGPSNVFVGFMEEIKSDPAELFSRICRFLGVSGLPESELSALASTVNSSQHYTGPMPEQVKRYLCGVLHPIAIETEKILGSYTTNWRQEIESYLTDHAEPAHDGF